MGNESFIGCVGISRRSRNDADDIFRRQEDANPHNNFMGVYISDGGSTERNEGGTHDTDLAVRKIIRAEV